MMFVVIVLSFLLLAGQSLAQRDPLKDFCRLHSHQTALVDRKLYIDGGFVNWSPLDANPKNFSSTWIKEGDLDVNNQAFPQQTTLAKNETVPSVVGGTLWADEANRILYMYGGEYGNQQPEVFKLWAYDIVYNTWNESEADTSNVRRAAWGGSAVAQDKAIAYYYGGWVTEYSEPGYGEPTALSNMLSYDMIVHTFKNQSGPDNVPRAEGVMLYIPAGDAGLLVYFGGVELPYGNETQRAVPMDEIRIYDIANNRWYMQTASGDRMPESRRRFCAGATWAQDKSSYNIYLYGGASVGRGPGFGDFYGSEDDNNILPHHSLTCDVIGGTQMIVMGGHFTNYTDCDVPSIYGQHGLDLGKASGSKWAGFKPNLTTYNVPEEITKVIGGTGVGSASLKAPREGWEAADLQVQFSRSYTPGQREATRPIPTNSLVSDDSSSNKKAVIGGAVGGSIGGVLLIALGTFLFFLYRRRKLAQQKQFHFKEEGEAQMAKPPPEAIGRPTSDLHGQAIYRNTSPSTTHQKWPTSPGGTYQPSTPHGSPPPPSDRTWSYHAGSSGPTYPGQTTFAAPVAVHSSHQRVPSDQTYHLPSQTPPNVYGISPQEISAPHELPAIKSPVEADFNAQSQPQPQPQPQAMSQPHELANSGISPIDPYFAQNPPR